MTFSHNGYALLTDILAAGEASHEIALADAAILEKDKSLALGGPSKSAWCSRDQYYYIETDDRLAKAILRRDKVALLLADIGFERHSIMHVQYIVKKAHSSFEFSWHQDLAYDKALNKGDYLTLWIALQDVDSENGGIEIADFPAMGCSELVEHSPNAIGLLTCQIEPDTPHKSVPIPKGSGLFLSNTVVHRSLRNRSDSDRHAYVIILERC
jgi:ectoine hydroxylase-related dioxygenase (phytanoyl-CoA dioxygenase family)